MCTQARQDQGDGEFPPEGVLVDEVPPEIPSAGLDGRYREQTATEVPEALTTLVIDDSIDDGLLREQPVQRRLDPIQADGTASLPLRLFVDDLLQARR